jgi:predicted DNA binding CopG/RHH family protein
MPVMCKVKFKTIPKFINEDEERKFWETHDTWENFDFDKGIEAEFPNLKPTTELISLRLPKSVLSDIKRIATKNGIPYQSLIKMLLADKVNEILTDKSQQIRKL